MKLGLGLLQGHQASDPLGPEMWDNPVPTINDDATSTGAYNTETQTLSNTGGALSDTYPRFKFNLGLTSGRTYRVTGLLTGGTGSVPVVQFQGGVAIDYDSGTGVIGPSDAVTGGAEFHIRINGQDNPTVVIASLSIKEVL